MAIACPNKNSKEWQNFVKLYGEDRAYRAFIANNYTIPTMNEDTTFEDLDTSETLDPSRFQQIPFKFSANKVLDGTKSLTVRDRQYSDQTYSHPQGIFNVSNQGKYNLKDYLEIQGLTLDQFKKKFLGDEDAKYGHIKDFLDGKSEMWIYKLSPVTSVDDVIVPMDDMRFQKTLQQKQRILRNLRTELKGKLNPTRRQELKDRVDKLQEQVDRLQDIDKRTFDTIVQNAGEDFELVSNLIASGINQHDIQYAKSLVYGYATTLDQFDLESDEDIDKQSNILSMIAQLNKDLDSAVLTIGNSITQQETGKQILINGTKLLLDSKDIGKDTLYGLDTTKNQNIIVQTITKLIKRANQTRDQVLISFDHQNEKIVKALKTFQQDKGLKGDQIYDYMIQTYTSGEKKGQKSGLSVSEYKPEYYDELKKHKRGKDKLLFLAKSHTFSVNKEAWELKQKNVREYFNNIPIELTERQIAQRLTVEEVRTQLADRAIANLNPYEMKKILDKVGKDEKSLTSQDYESFKQFEDRYGWREEGQQILEKKADSKWNDPKYAEIQKMSNADPRKVFFEHYDKNIREGRMELSDSESYLPWNYIPERKKDLGIVKNFQQWGIDQISQKIAQNIHGIDPITEEPLKEIPVFTLSGKVRPEDKSYDLNNVLKSFVYEMKNKKYMSEIEDDALLLESILKQQKVYETNPDGTPKTINGERVYKKTGSNNYEQAQYRIAASIYMERQAKEGVTKGKTYNVVDQDRMKEIKEQITNFNYTDEQKRDLNQYIGTDNLDNLTSDQQQYVKLATELREIESNFKNITASKLVNFGRLWTSIKLLGLNIFGGITEMMQGIGSLMIEGAAGEFFTSKQGLQGLGTMIKYLSLSKDNPERIKIDRLSKLFKVEGELNYGEERNAITNIAYYQYKLAKLFVNNAFLLAMLNNEQIKDNNGVSHSLYDVMSIDENYIIQLPENFENPYTRFDQNGEVILTDASLNLQQKFREIIKSNRDRDSSEDPILLDKSAIGRILGQFKASWMFEAFNKRFGKERGPDLYTSKSSKGFYRSFKDTFLKQEEYVDDLGEIQYRTKWDIGQGVKTLWQFSFFQKYGKDGYKGELSELDQANLKRFLREMTLISMMVTTIAILRSLAGGDDDDKDYVKSKSLNYLINQSIRINRDLTTYISPNSFASILKNPAPITSTLVDFTQIAGAIIDTGLGHPYAYQGTSREYLKIPRRIEETTPGARQIRGLLSKFDREINYTGN